MRFPRNPNRRRWNSRGESRSDFPARRGIEGIFCFASRPGLTQEKSGIGLQQPALQRPLSIGVQHRAKRCTESPPKRPQSPVRRVTSSLCTDRGMNFGAWFRWVAGKMRRSSESANQRFPALAEQGRGTLVHGEFGLLRTGPPACVLRQIELFAKPAPTHPMARIAPHGTKNPSTGKSTTQRYSHADGAGVGKRYWPP